MAQDEATSPRGDASAKTGPDAEEPGRVAVSPDTADATPKARPPAAREPDDEAPAEPPDEMPGEGADDAPAEPADERVVQPAAGPAPEPADVPRTGEDDPGSGAPDVPQSPATVIAPAPEPASAAAPEPASAAAPTEPVPDPAGPANGQLLPGDPDELPLPPRAVARGRLGHAMRPRATRAQLLAGALCALLGFALVVQARQTQTQGLDSLRQADLVRLLDNVTNAEARAEQDVRDEQAIRDRLLSGTDSSAAAQEAAQQRLDTLGILAGTVPAAGPGIQLEITDPRRQVDASVLLDTLEELRDGGAEVVQIGNVRVVAATAFTDEADGVRVDQRLLTPPYTFKIIGDPQTLSRLLQIPGGVLDVLHSKGAQGTVTQPATVTIDALRSPTRPQYARPAPGATP